MFGASRNRSGDTFQRSSSESPSSPSSIPARLVTDAPHSGKRRRSIADYLTAWQGLGKWAAAAWLVIACAIFLRTVTRHYRFGDWLFASYLELWAGALVFFAACLVSGLELLARIDRTPGPVAERFTLAFGLGVLLFASGVFVAGLCSALVPAFFLLWPLALTAFGARRSSVLTRRWLAHFRRLEFRSFVPRSPWQASAAALLALGCAAIYLQVINRHNLGADAHSYHIPIAEHYVAAGKIRPFQEGWYLGAYPHLASLLYTWALLSPGSTSLDYQLVQQVEWVVFVATLIGVAAWVRRLLGVRVPAAAAAVFLFPGIFFYDSNLIATADHVLAFWSVPLALALMKLQRSFGVREGVLAGLMLAGAILTKHQALLFVAATAVALVVLVAQNRRFWPLVAFGLACAAACSSHWLKNWVFYGNPIYPFASEWFPATHPFYDGAAEAFRTLGPMPSGQGLNGRLLKALWNFSFMGGRAGNVPVFGSLFTLLLPLIVLLRAPRRIGFLALVIHLCLAIWWLTYNDPRFLQLLLPAMAVVTASLLVLAWRSGTLVRFTTGTLVGLQLVWGADTYFFREHSWIGDNPLKFLIDDVAAGHAGKSEQRRTPVGALEELGTLLPPHSKLLVHDLENGQLGARSQVVADKLGWQGAISYRLLDTPRQVAGMWRKLGVTHTVFYSDRGNLELDELVSELAYRRAVTLVGEDLGLVGGRHYVALTANKPSSTPLDEPARIAWLGCGAPIPNGMYTLEGARAGQPTQALDEATLAARGLEFAAAANVIVTRDDCAASQALGSFAVNFTLTGRANNLNIWVRTVTTSG